MNLATGSSSAQLPLLDQHHRRDRRDRLGHRGDAIDRRPRDRHARLGVLHSGSHQMHDLSAPGHQGRAAGDLPILHGRFDQIHRSPPASPEQIRPLGVATRARLEARCKLRRRSGCSNREVASESERRQRRTSRLGNGSCRTMTIIVPSDYFNSLIRISLNCTVIGGPREPAGR